MSTQNHDLFEKCLAELQAGKPLHEVLDAQPQARGELESLLQLALQMSSDPGQDPKQEAINLSRSRMLAKAAELRDTSSKPGFLGWIPRYAVGVAAVLFILVSSYGLFSASAESLPGDLLYPIKRSAESLRLDLTTREGKRQLLEASFEERRGEEVAQLLQQGRVARVSFEGRVAQMGSPHWLVEDIRVSVNASTRIIGEIQLDDEIEVEGETRPEGFVLAFELHKRLMTLAGRVEHIGVNHWEIDGRIVALTLESEIEDEISVGDFVTALVAVADDESLSLIEVRLDSDEADEHTPRSTPEPDPERIEFTGLVDSIGTISWIVDGRLVRINTDTDIDDDIEVGDTVRVRAEERGGILWALDIDERDGGDEAEMPDPDESDTASDDELSDDDSDDDTDDPDQDDDDSGDEDEEEEEKDDDDEEDDEEEEDNS